MTALFGKNKKQKDKDREEPKKIETGEFVREEGEENILPGSSAFSSTGGAGTHKVIKSFYVSEKSSLGTASSQYMFKVSDSANKSEVKKEISRLFNVKVKNIKILNMPEKRRDFGKHPGARSGFKKAIVVLKPGFSIGQAKP